MKTLLICFSQTGNTRRIAKCIQEGIVEANSDCNLMTLKEVNLGDVRSYDLVGIGCPVYYLREPFNVGNFLESLPQLDGQHWFVFCTHGNVIGNVFPSVSKKLSDVNATVIGYHHSYANISVPFYPRPSYTSGHPDEHDLNEAIRFGREIVDRSRLISEGRKDLIPPPGPVSTGEWLDAAKRFSPELLKQVMPKLRINLEKCTECGMCKDQCPVDGIDIAVDPARMQNPCISCWNCTIVCPVQAIGADWEPLVRMAPDYYRRYRIALEEAEAKGEFRWLIDPDTIDFNAPLYKQLEMEVTSE